MKPYVDSYRIIGEMIKGSLKIGTKVKIIKQFYKEECPELKGKYGNIRIMEDRKAVVDFNKIMYRISYYKLEKTY